MNMDRVSSSTDKYFLTAVQIFEYCGADSGGTLRVDALMDKFAPFDKNNKAAYSYLKSLLDPEHIDPEIDVTNLASALNKFTECQKTIVDLDESFNLKTGPMPHDSDSGISTDGSQLLEDLQCELREKSHLAAQLRSQLDYTDRQHEEALATLTAERDSLRAHLNMLREENMTLTHVRRDYEETCDRLCHSEQALCDARRDLDAARRKNKALAEELAALENEKLSLQELLTKSKDECHRINEMYLSRQVTLREENEMLKTEHADLTARLQDQDEFMQQMIKEKVLLEMELKDLVNKSNQIGLRLDRSIDVSYCEDHALTALDTLTHDSELAQENSVLDEESFTKSLKDEQGRATNISLFDEIRLSFCSMTRPSFFDNNDCAKCDSDDTPCDKCRDNSRATTATVETQTDDNNSLGVIVNSIETQTDNMAVDINYNYNDNYKNTTVEYTEQAIQTNLINESENKESQTDQLINDNNNCSGRIKCNDCENLSKHAADLERKLQHSNTNMSELQTDLDKYEDNLTMLQKILDEEKGTNNYLQSVVSGMQRKIALLEFACSEQNSRICSLGPETNCVECQTLSDQASVSTQADVPCIECDKRKAVLPQKGIRKFLWEPLKCLFQVFAVVCLLCALCVLYGVTGRWAHCRPRADRAAVPWRWLDAHDLMDLLLRIEYVADVPM